MSELWKLGKQDWIKSLVITVLTAVLTLVLQMLQNGVNIDWKTVGITALTAALAYILKQLGTDNEGKILGKI